MTDRELLEAAAKAAGIRLLPAVEGREPRTAPPDLATWNPLTDDGDALRLAVKLLMRVTVNRAMGLKVPGSVTIEYPNEDGFYVALAEAVSADPYAATRRAIVRAAAEIGKDAK